MTRPNHSDSKVRAWPALAFACACLAAADEAMLTADHAGPVTLATAPTFDAAKALFPKATVRERTVTEFAGQPYPVVEVSEGKHVVARLVSFDRARLDLVQVLTPKWRTGNGLGVGSTFEQLTAAHADLACKISDTRWQDVACSPRSARWLVFVFQKLVTAQDQLAITMGSGDASPLARKKRVTSVEWLVVR